MITTPRWLMVDEPLWSVRGTVIAVLIAVMAASPALAEPPPLDVPTSVSSRDAVRDLAFGFSPSDRVFFTNVTFAIRGNEHTIGQRDRH